MVVMKFCCWFFLFACLFGPAWVCAQNKGADPCESDHVQISLNFCAELRYHQADDSLNAVGKRFQAMQFPEDMNRKPTSHLQGLWLQYRDGHCAAIAKMENFGSMAPMLRFNCLCSLTEQSIAELSMLIALDGGR